MDVEYYYSGLVILLSQEIKYRFSAKMKAGALFVDLTTDDTVRHHAKVLRLVPDRHMNLFMELSRNRSFASLKPSLHEPQLAVEVRVN